jgi:hypothetical protein
MIKPLGYSLLSIIVFFFFMACDSNYQPEEEKQSDLVIEYYYIVGGYIRDASAGYYLSGVQIYIGLERNNEIQYKQDPITVSDEHGIYHINQWGILSTKVIFKFSKAGYQSEEIQVINRAELVDRGEYKLDINLEAMQGN